MTKDRVKSKKSSESKLSSKESKTSGQKKIKTAHLKKNTKDDPSHPAALSDEISLQSGATVQEVSIDYEVDKSLQNVRTGPSEDSAYKDFELMEEDDDYINEFVYEFEQNGKDSPKLSRSEFIMADHALPNLSDITFTEEEEEVEIRPSVVQSVGEDVGHFVNPITGSTESESSSEKPTSVVEQNVVVDEEDFESSSSEFELNEVDLEPRHSIRVIDEYGADAFIEYQRALISVHEEPPDQVITNEMVAKEIVNDFLKKLIDNIVFQCEQVDEMERFRVLFDKAKIYKDIDKLLKDYDMEVQLNVFFQRKISEYFRRNKFDTFISEENAKTEKIEKEKYEIQMGLVDKYLLAEHELQTKADELLPDLEASLKQAENDLRMADESFEHVIRTTLIKPNHTELKTFVDRELNRVFCKRKEVQTERFQLILHQHTLSKIETELAQLEYITEDLSIGSFLSMQNEILSLERKLEEKEMEMHRINLKSTRNVHTYTHLREKQQVIVAAINESRELLEEVKETNKNKRELLNKRGVQHVNIRHQISQAVQTAGLLDKPMLLYDYDETLHIIEQYENNIQNLSAEYQDILHRITAFNPNFKGLEHEQMRISSNLKKPF